MTPALVLPVRRTTRPRTDEERAQVLAAPGFGRVMTDHMVIAEWTHEHGWAPAEIVPHAPLELDPANMALHYGQSIFEGLKAYHWPDGSVRAFRPTMNAARFARSARRMAMPELPEDTFLAALTGLVEVDRAWLPTAPETSLYLRPLMFATENGLGVRPANRYLFLLLASPAGAYFARGLSPVTVWISDDYVRAAPGGTGEAKCAGNYAASLVAQAEAMEHGCDQVVWLDAAERQWVEEMGGMNLFFVYGAGEDAHLVTPELTGALLPGVTRDSLLRLAPDLGIPAREGRVSVADWRSGVATGEITEVFACGTAAVITPVGAARTRTEHWTVGEGGTGPVTARLREALLAIQTGRQPDPYGWTVQLAEPA